MCIFITFSFHLPFVKQNYTLLSANKSDPQDEWAKLMPVHHTTQSLQILHSFQNNNVLMIEHLRNRYGHNNQRSILILFSSKALSTLPHCIAPCLLCLLISSSTFYLLTTTTEDHIGFITLPHSTDGSSSAAPCRKFFFFHFYFLCHLPVLNWRHVRAASRNSRTHERAWPG